MCERPSPNKFGEDIREVVNVASSILGGDLQSEVIKYGVGALAKALFSELAKQEPEPLEIQKEDKKKGKSCGTTININIYS